ncbi:hypothetical protein ACFZAU_38545 [Streptomyces sp. NPDC008238]
MSEQTRTHLPGTAVPDSGIYECTCGNGHRFASTDVQGHAFPPVPKDCSGIGWNLLISAHAKDRP